MHYLVLTPLPGVMLDLSPPCSSTLQRKHSGSSASGVLCLQEQNVYDFFFLSFFWQYLSLGVLFIHFLIKFYSLLFFNGPQRCIFLSVNLKWFAIYSFFLLFFIPKNSFARLQVRMSSTDHWQVVYSLGESSASLCPISYYPMPLLDTAVGVFTSQRSCWFNRLIFLYPVTPCQSLTYIILHRINTNYKYLYNNCGYTQK